MAPGLGFQGAIVGYGAETVYGTPVAVTKFNELNSDGLVVNEERIHSAAIPAIFNDDDEVSQGQINCAGDLAIEMRYQGMETLIKHAMGAVASTEVASFVVGATNNKLDFNIGAGALVATIASGTYIMGASQLTALSLCKAIYDAIVSAEGTGTYTVTYSTTTNKVTITRSAGTFSILWNTGTNTLVSIAALIGFSTAADSTGGLTYTGATALTAVYDHVFTLADALPTGLTLEIDRDITAFTFAGGKINTMAMTIEANNFLMATFGIIANQVANAAATAQSLPTSPLVVFSQGAITYGGASTNVKTFNFTLNNQLSTDRRFIGSRIMAEPQRSAKIDVSGSLTLEFDDATKYADFRAMTSRAVVLTCTGAVIKAALTYGITINFPIVKLTGNTPTVNNAGVITVDYPFKAYASDSSSREMTITVRNSLASV